MNVTFSSLFLHMYQHSKYASQSATLFSYLISHLICLIDSVWIFLLDNSAKSRISQREKEKKTTTDSNTHRNEEESGGFEFSRFQFSSCESSQKSSAKLFSVYRTFSQPLKSRREKLSLSREKMLYFNSCDKIISSPQSTARHIETD